MEPLGNDDVPEMLELVAAAQPGPFLSRTVEFGGYVGVRHEGRLIAMAGERMRPDGHAEISAVATHPAHRRQGLGESLVRTVAAGILGRGEIPFLHVATDNSRAIALYERLGFTVRREVAILVVEAPTA
jgi:predicted GNAT family acetyltransferase